jgi:hypothetical protein
MADESAMTLEPTPVVETVQTVEIDTWTGTANIDSWGFILYRTVYSKESEQKWLRVLELLPKYILYGIKANTPRRQPPYGEVNFLRVTRENSPTLLRS